MIRETRSETTMKGRLPPVRTAKIRNTRNSRCGEEAEKRESSCTAGGVRAGAAAVETVWRVLSELEIELP